MCSRNSPQRRDGSCRDGCAAFGWRRALSAVVLAAMMPAVVLAAEPDKKFDWYGDFRFRLERDWDSQTAAGTPREDRDRARVRGRLGVDFRPDENFTFGFRMRSGSEASSQSPHITIIDFDDNDTGDADVNFDKWFARGQTGNLWGWVGRNSFPFWAQNELFWDDDVTPAGVAGGYKHGYLALNAGYFSLPVGMRTFAGSMGAVQAVYATKFGDTGFTAALGRYLFDANPVDPDAATLRNGNGTRDYAIWVGSVQVKFAVGGRPLTLGVDVMRNTEDYDASMANRDQRDGHVFSVLYGGLKDKGDWLAGYYYARIERFAVNASYAQDDWVRWGSATESDSSDFKGHELRAGYAFQKNFNVLARLYLVDAITSVQDGKRFRVDFNYKF